MPREVKWAISLAVGLGLVWAGWKVYFLLVTLHIIICGLLIIVIMLQSGEAADLAGAFGGAGSQTAFGPRGAATFLSKATTWCAIMFMLTSFTLTMHVDNTVAPTGSSVLQQFSKTSKTPASPAKPAAPALPTTPAAPASGVPTPAPLGSAPAPATPAPATPAPSK
jgi:preprotein translocase subunit SecG